MVQQRVSDGFRRGTNVNKQRGAVRDLRGDLTGNALFFCRLRGLTIMPGVFTELDGNAAPPWWRKIMF